MQVKINHIGIFSAFKLGCLMAALPILIVAIAVAVVIIVNGEKTGIAVPLALSVPSILLYAILADLLCGVLAASQAIVFNVGARLFGGLVIQFDRTAWKKVQIGASTTSAVATPTIAANPSYSANATPPPTASIPPPIAIAPAPPTQPVASSPASNPSKTNLPPYVSPTQPDVGMPPSSDGKDKMAAHDEVAILKKQVEARMKRIEEINRTINKRP